MNSTIESLDVSSLEGNGHAACQRDIDVQILTEVSFTFCDALKGCIEAKPATYAM